jgi:succinylglutamate desuccinylase
MAVCGIHGNEPAGVRAAEAVLEELRRRRLPFRGEFIALAGNLQALAQGRRFIKKDLNRQWTLERLEALEALARAPSSEGLSGEDREQLEMWEVLRPALERSTGPAILLDLHTSSAEGPPFATMGDTLGNREFVTQLPIPVILGLEEQIDGALLEYVNNLGHVTVGVEAGRHDLASTVQRHEAILWLSLIAAGSLRNEDLPEAAAYREELRRATQGIPRIVEMRYRHPIREGDGFVMRPGFRNFDPVAKRDVVATDRGGSILAREKGLILLPLYQALGDDGFFLGRKVNPRWLTLSAVLRRLEAHSLPRLLPGVYRHPRDEGTLIIDTRIARLFPLEVFHLLGYRKRRWRGRYLVVSRRRDSLARS